jgi:hypothetical protein
MDFPLQYIIHVLEMDSSFVIHMTVVVCFSQVTARFSLSSIFFGGERKRRIKELLKCFFYFLIE